jgi:hypothetical protein
MDDRVVSYRVDESHYVGSLLEGDRPSVYFFFLLPLKPYAVLVRHA